MAVDKYMTKSGTRWRFRAEAPPDPATGVRRRISKGGFRTQREAKAAERDVLATGDLDVLAHRDARDQTVAGFLVRWLEGFRARPTTLAGYRVALEKHVVPAVGPCGCAR